MLQDNGKIILIHSSVVDSDFAIKYHNKVYLDHFLQVLITKYNITNNWIAKQCCDITIDWEYVTRTVKPYLPPSYMDTVLARFWNPSLNTPEHLPHDWLSLTCGSIEPNPIHYSTLPILPQSDTLRIQ